MNLIVAPDYKTFALLIGMGYTDLKWVDENLQPEWELDEERVKAETFRELTEARFNIELPETAVAILGSDWRSGFPSKDEFTRWLWQPGDRAVACEMSLAGKCGPFMGVGLALIVFLFLSIIPVAELFHISNLFGFVAILSGLFFLVSPFCIWILNKYYSRVKVDENGIHTTTVLGKSRSSVWKEVESCKWNWNGAFHAKTKAGRVIKIPSQFPGSSRLASLISDHLEDRKPAQNK